MANANEKPEGSINYREWSKSVTSRYSSKPKRTKSKHY